MWVKKLLASAYLMVTLPPRTKADLVAYGSLRLFLGVIVGLAIGRYDVLVMPVVTVVVVGTIVHLYQQFKWVRSYQGPCEICGRPGLRIEAGAVSRSGRMEAASMDSFVCRDHVETWLRLKYRQLKDDDGQS